MAGATTLALAAISAGTAIYSAVKGKKGEAMAPPPPPPPPPAIVAAPDPADDSQAAATALTKRRKQAANVALSGTTKSGRAATLLTGPSGLSAPASTERKTLLGA